MTQLLIQGTLLKRTIIFSDIENMFVILDESQFQNVEKCIVISLLNLNNLYELIFAKR